jgi:predicted esterase
MKNKFGKCLLLVFFALSGSAFGMSLDQEIQQGHDDNFTEARFRLWLPEKAQRVSGLIVLVPGLQSDGLDLVNDLRWQLLAAKWNFGLLGCTLRDRSGTYYLADKGTGRALLEALQKLSRRSNHPEIKEAPLAMWGYSAGGQFNYNFTSLTPERVIAFVAVKGAYYDAPTDSRSRSVPALFFIGEKDEAIRVRNITDVFETNRRQGAPWCVAIVPNEGHGIGKTVDFALSFFDAVIPQRLDHKGGLRVLNQSTAWLGNVTSHEIAAASSYSQPASDAVWLPDESTALKWKQFVSPEDLSRVSSAPVSTAIVPQMTPAFVALLSLIAVLLLLSLRFHKPLKR